jgi:hypothetical protein
MRRPVSLTSASALLAPTLMLALAGCPLALSTDTCAPTEADELTMDNPQVPDGLVDLGDGRWSFVLTWEPFGVGPASELPASYFDTVRVDDDQAATAAHLGEQRIEVVLQDPANDAPQWNVGLFFDDRRDHIDCGHAGMDDVYLVDLTFRFDDERNVESINITQGRLLGAI